VTFGLTILGSILVLPWRGSGPGRCKNCLADAVWPETGWCWRCQIDREIKKGPAVAAGEEGALLIATRGAPMPENGHHPACRPSVLGRHQAGIRHNMGVMARD